MPDGDDLTRLLLAAAEKPVTDLSPAPVLTFPPDWPVWVLTADEVREAMGFAEDDRSEA